MNREPIFITADMREADSVERVLDGAGVRYTLRLDAIAREGGACFQGILYEWPLTKRRNAGGSSSIRD